MRFESIAITHTGLVRDANQDSMLEVPESGIFLVADGMGGEQAGDEASAQVVETVKVAAKTFFKRQPTGPSQIEGMMRDTLLEANHEVIQIAVREPAKRGLGSTASLLCLHRGVYFIAQVGDSRVYRVREGKVTQLTRDHTLVWMLYEQGSITYQQLETHPERHLLTQCIGSERPIRVDTFEGEIQVGDLFMVCSDGLTGYATEERTFEILLEDPPDIKGKAQTLIDEALEAGGGDNVTVILARVTSLEDSDDWKPEATAPPTDFDITTTDTLIDAEVGRHVTARPAKNLKPLIGALAVLVLIIIGVASLLTGGDSPVKVDVTYPAEGAPPRDEIEVASRRDDKALPRQALQQDDQGLSIELPGKGEYHLILESTGYMPQFAQIEIDNKDEVPKLELEAWVAMGELVLKLPPDPPATSLKLTRDGRGDSASPELNMTRAELEQAENPLRLWLEPVAQYVLTVQAEGFKPFIKRIIIRSGREKTYKVQYR